MTFEAIKRRVLFVDDEAEILHGLRCTLRKQRKSWDMHFAVGGEDALRFLEQEQVDAIVTDMRMPGMDGAELLAEARRLAPGACRLILSGQTDAAMALRALPVAHQFLHKPCEREEIVAAVDRKCGVRDLLHDADLQRLVVETKALPSPATSRSQLAHALTNPLFGHSEIAACIQRDAALSAKFLQLANSAFFSLPHVVVEVSEAIALLGIPTIEHVIESGEVFENMPVDTLLQGQAPEEFQRTNFAVSLLSARIAEECGMNTRVARTAGLLHDLGVLALAQARPARSAAAWVRALDEHITFSEAEEADFGATHAALGASLLGVWGLPDTIVDAVARHHSPVRDRFDVDGVVHVANALVGDVVHKDKAPLAGHDVLDREWLAQVGHGARLPRWRELAERVVASANQGVWG